MEIALEFLAKNLHDFRILYCNNAQGIRYSGSSTLHTPIQSQFPFHVPASLPFDSSLFCKFPYRTLNSRLTPPTFDGGRSPSLAKSRLRGSFALPPSMNISSRLSTGKHWLIFSKVLFSGPLHRSKKISCVLMGFGFRMVLLTPLYNTPR